MNSEDRFWLGIWGLVTIVILAMLGLWFNDMRMTERMADKGLCFVSVDRSNAQAAWQWQRCK